MLQKIRSFIIENKEKIKALKSFHHFNSQGFLCEENVSNWSEFYED